MMFDKYVLILIFWFPLLLNGQQVITLSDSDQNYSVGTKEITILRDSIDQYDFDEIVTLYQENKFKSLPPYEFAIPELNESIWLHLIVDKSATTESTFLELLDWKVRYADIYIQQSDNTYDATFVGAYRKSKNKSISHKNYVVELTRDLDLVHCFIRMESDMNNPFLIRLKSSSSLVGYSLSE